MNCLSPSILSADFGILGEQVKLCDEAGSPYIHFDVMDGSFVPSISFGLPVLKSIRKYTDKILDVHLMIDNPDKYIEEFAKAGADIITIHAESCKHLDASVELVKKQGKMVGVAINPATSLETVKWILPKIDMLLVMTVNPGFGGQKLIPYTLDKVKEAREYANSNNLNYDIEVDGGVNKDNINQYLEAGANIIVAGSAVFNGDIAANVKELISKMN